MWFFVSSLLLLGGKLTALSVPVNIAETRPVDWLHGIATLQHTTLQFLGKTKTTFRAIDLNWHFPLAKRDLPLPTILITIGYSQPHYASLFRDFIYFTSQRKTTFKNIGNCFVYLPEFFSWLPEYHWQRPQTRASQLLQLPGATFCNICFISVRSGAGAA
jgi:hypothetical protein